MNAVSWPLRDLVAWGLVMAGKGQIGFGDELQPNPSDRPFHLNGPFGVKKVRRLVQCLKSPPILSS